LRYRASLAALYATALPPETQRERKATLLAAMRAEYAQIKATRWGGFAGYDRWFEEANNASLAVLAAYFDLVPAFERLFDRAGGDFDRFYDEVRALAALPREQRRATLDAIR
jgi:predicted aminopeptidase